MTLENLGEEGATSSRNAVLLKILEDVPIPGEDRTVCENRGSGIRAMVNSLRRFSAWHWPCCMRGPFSTTPPIGS
ncbi:ATP-binding protein [Actinoplanes sp. NPDC051411]|uniref:ATP-binding protein n=1 Tax=Actinoplanes sp. NPDC051411 TaxID=3155522 RepID=UPI00344202D4